MIEFRTLAGIVADGFRAYRARRHAIEGRTRAKFEARDWRGIRRDLLERIDAYGVHLDAAIASIRATGFEPDRDRKVWQACKTEFRTSVADDPFAPVAETFFNSLTRKMFGTEGVDESLEFLDDPPTIAASPSVTTEYAGDADGEGWLAAMLRDARFQTSWVDIHGDIAKVRARLPFQPESVEIVTHRFYRGKAAYIVGSMQREGMSEPFAIAIRHRQGGLHIAALMVGEEDVSILFSYTRAAFLVTTSAPGNLVDFLARLLPHRSPSELWSAIGYRKQAKSARYRELLSHLSASDKPFIRAPGVEGLVMIVFTLAEYDVVFKVIRDRFPPQKNVTPRQVAERYQLVARHDRAGRLVSAQRFHDLRLPVRRFDPELLDELLDEAGRTVHRHGDDVTFTTVYLERRVTPLDIHLRHASPDEAARAIADYGTAIKNLAASNIFPGDMLLKNFGVTNRGRVVFYDYDELTELTNCRFRALPDTDDPLSELSSTPAFGIGPNDVFPEELPRFLGLTDDLRSALDARHADLFTPGFWQTVQARIESGETIEILPYRRERRLDPSRPSS